MKNKLLVTSAIMLSAALSAGVANASTLEDVKVADSVTFMAEGEIVEIGKPKQFFNKPNTAHAKEFLSHVL